ncbi:UNVERIFIED_ORG: hypothetical protein E4P37_12585 [Bacillus sp. AZ43]
MTLNLAGVLLAGTVWLLAAVLAGPADRPTAAVVLLSAQAATYLLLAVLAKDPLRAPFAARSRRRGVR